jgi:hypothetical protein
MPKRSAGAIRQQLQYVKCDLKYIDEMLLRGKVLPRWWDERLQAVRDLYEQQLYMYIQWSVARPGVHAASCDCR